MISKNEEENFHTFRDCLSTPLIENSTEQPSKKTQKAGKNRSGRKIALKPVSVDEHKETNDAAELAEFIDVVSLLHNSL